MCVCLYMCVYVCLCVQDVCMYVCVCMYACMRVCVCVCGGFRERTATCVSASIVVCHLAASTADRGVSLGRPDPAADALSGSIMSDDVDTAAEEDDDDEDDDEDEDEADTDVVETDDAVDVEVTGRGWGWG
jgi:hypothetical protein